MNAPFSVFAQESVVSHAVVAVISGFIIFWIMKRRELNMTRRVSNTYTLWIDPAENPVNIGPLSAPGVRRARKRMADE